MTQETVTKNQLEQYKTIPTRHTHESLIQEINLSGLITSSLDSLFAVLSHGIDFLEVSDDKQIVSYAEYVVDTSPYHKNESVNLVSVKVETKDGRQLGRPMMRLIHKESAETIASFLNHYGSEGAISTSMLMERASILMEQAHNSQALRQLQTFIARVAETLHTVDSEAIYRVFEEYILVALIQDSYEVFDISEDEIVKRIIDSMDDPADDDDTESSKNKSHLKVVK